MKITTVEATTLSDAWFRLLYQLLEKEDGRHVYTIDSGSYVGSKRYEFDYAIVQITHPGARPLIPEMPPHIAVPPPVGSLDYVEEYFARYLMSDEITENETYTYGTWLKPGIERVIEQLGRGAGTNQATISIGGWAACDDSCFFERRRPDGSHEHLFKARDTDNFIDPATGQRDPACLRVVDFRLDQENKLHMITLWRCLAEDQSLMYTENGVLKNGTVGDMYVSWEKDRSPCVLGFNQETGEHVFSPIIKAARRHTDDIFTIKLRDGSLIDVTPEHHVFVLEDNQLRTVQARHIKTGDIMVRASTVPDADCMDVLPVEDALLGSNHDYYLRDVPLSVIRATRDLGVNIKESWRDKRVLPIGLLSVVREANTGVAEQYKPMVGCARSARTWPADLEASDEWGYLMGAWLANGSKSDNRLKIATGQKKVIEKLVAILGRLGINYTICSQGKCEVFYLSDVFVRDLFVFCGFIGNAHSKSVPDMVFGFSQSIRMSVFEGWFEGDAGWSVSEDLVRDMQRVALSCGVTCSVYFEKPRTVVFPDGREVMSSGAHRLYPASGKRHSFWINGDSGQRLITSKVKEIGSVQRCGWVADFSVHGAENLFVGQGAMLVHNSWDLWGGFPANLAGLQLVKEYVAQEIGAEDGEMIASSKGLHIYSHAVNVAELRTGLVNK